MPKFVILRTQKLKSSQAIRRSLTHSFREQDTPNADAEKADQNSHFGAHNAKEALAKVCEKLPEKVRKNAVICVEYLVTASPEAMSAMSREQQDAYFADALKWLHVRHGADNVVYAGIHRDETTAHMYAYAVPLDERGRLNCRSFLGGAKALSDMQTDFAKRVGHQHGLERGLEGSKARHTTIRQYYARVNASEAAKTPAIGIPDPKLLEGKESYGQRVAKSVLEQLEGELKTLRAKAAHADLAQAQARSAEEARKRAEELAAQRLAERDKIRAEAEAQQQAGRDLLATIAAGGERLAKLQETARERIERAAAVNKKDLPGQER